MGISRVAGEAQTRKRQPLARYTRHSVGKRAFRLPRFVISESAQSLVEISLVLPLLVFGLLAGADLARAFAVQLAVQNGARAGAESYAIDQTPLAIEARQAAVDEMNRTPTLNAQVSDVSVTEAQIDGVSACIRPPTALTPACYVTVRV